MCLAAEAAATLRAGDEAQVLYELLSPFAGRHAIGQGEGSVGVVDRYLGLLAGSLGRNADAIAHLRRAVAGNHALGADLWLAHAPHALAASLRLAPGAEAADAAHRLTAESMATAERLGLVALQRRIDRSARPPAEATVGPSLPATFRQEGDYWTVALDGEPARIRDSRGMNYIARLLGQPGREFHAIDLARGGTRHDAPKHDGAGLVLETEDAGPQLDEEAKAAYRARLVELEEEVAEAESWNDPERAGRAQQEIALLVAELRRAVGLGGRDRKAASASERARVSVTRAIRAAIDRVATGCPAAGDHLKRTIRTGTYCSYVPDPRAPIAWQL